MTLLSRFGILCAFFLYELFALCSYINLLDINASILVLKKILCFKILITFNSNLILAPSEKKKKQA